jgi:hypothetical protein
MRCLKEKVLTRYLDSFYTGKDAERIKQHILECKVCRIKMEKIKKEIEYISQKTEILSPSEIPEKDFVFPVYSKQRLSFSFVPVAAAFIFMLILVSVFWLIFQNRDEGILSRGENILSIVEKMDERETVLEKKERQSIIRRISVAGQPVQTYIIRDPENKTTLIWVEKKAKREVKNEENI